MGFDAVLSMNKISKSASQRLFSFTSYTQIPKKLEVELVYATGLDSFVHEYSPPNNCVLNTNLMLGEISESSRDETNSTKPSEDSLGKEPHEVCSLTLKPG